MSWATAAKNTTALCKLIQISLPNGIEAGVQQGIIWVVTERRWRSNRYRLVTVPAHGRPAHGKWELGTAGQRRTSSGEEASVHCILFYTFSILFQVSCYLLTVNLILMDKPCFFFFFKKSPVFSHGSFSDLLPFHGLLLPKRKNSEWFPQTPATSNGRRHNLEQTGLALQELKEKDAVVSLVKICRKAHASKRRLIKIPQVTHNHSSFLQFKRKAYWSCEKQHDNFF